MSRPLLTLLTDFGTADYFVAAMKGAILSMCADCQIVDLTHDIAPQDIHAAAFTLLAACQSFPSGTIHVAVVDPGVGSARRPVLARCTGQFFVGPDNGIFSYVWERAQPEQVIHIQAQEFFRQPVSATFHGRDIFAPVAAALANGVESSRFGPEISDWVRLESLSPVSTADGIIHARIIHIDRFGNCVTNVSKEQVTEEMAAKGAQLSINGREIDSFRTFYAEAGADQSEGLFAIWGSAGFLEIVARNASAAEVLDAKVGQAALLKTKPR
jgi:S-adenosylmethionine hydrolase